MISFCIIVKNEEKYLERCLDSIKTLSDDIIIVDTGSTDNTKQIAAKYTDNIYDFVWTNNFADARNYSISKATGDWIMWLDADNYFDPEQAEKLKRIMKNPHVIRNDVINVAIRDLNSKIVWSVPKIFRNNVGIRFKNPIHETLDYKGKNIVAVDVYLNHDRPGAVDREERYFKMLQEQYAVDKDDVSTNFYLASYNLRRKNHDTAAMHYQNMLKSAEMQKEAFTGLSRISYYKKNYTDALEYAYKSLMLDNSYPDIYVLIANIYDELGQKLNAITANKIALRLDKNFSTNTITNEEAYNYVPWVNLAKLYVDIMAIDRAIESYNEALKYADTQEKKNIVLKNLELIKTNFKKLEV
ncbi:MAG: glycosyltransferase [Elusimicrobiota bacterium]